MAGYADEFRAAFMSNMFEGMHPMNAMMNDMIGLKVSTGREELNRAYISTTERLGILIAEGKAKQVPDAIIEVWTRMAEDYRDKVKATS